MSPQPLDLAALVRERFANPRPWPDAPDYRTPGRAALRQLHDVDRDEDAAQPPRVSSLGKCARALAYRWRGVPVDGRRIDGRARIVFTLGDVVESLVVSALVDALDDRPAWSLHNVGEDQETIHLDPGGGFPPIPGHPDGLLCRDGQPWAVLEVKSASSFAFQRARKLLAEGVEPWGPGEGYHWQLQGYLAALDLDVGAVVMVSKDSGAVLSWYHDRDPGFLARLREHLERASLPPEEAPRMLPDGTVLGPRVDWHKTRKPPTPNRRHGQLPWQCRYCSHSGPSACWGDRVTRITERDYRGAPSVGLYVDRPDMEGTS